LKHAGGAGPRYHVAEMPRRASFRHLAKVPAAALIAPFALAAAALVPGCGSEPAPRAASRPSLLDRTEASGVSYPMPARWRYHPREASTLLAETRLPDGRTVYAGARGERWLADPRAGVAEAASTMAPEDLVAIARRGERWLFVGRSGASYESSSPLGVFERANAPLEALVHVSAAGSSLFGLRRDGAIRRSQDAGASWTRVGPEGTRFEDVVVDADGKGLALSVPEALWETLDYGASFHRLDLPRAAVEDVALDGSAGLSVVTPLGDRRFVSEPVKSLVPLGRPVKRRAHALAHPAPLGPSAASLVEGRAVVDRDRWLEARLTQGGAFSLVTGTLSGKLSIAELAPAKGCVEVHLAGFGSTLYLSCARQRPRGITQPFELSRSNDGGKTWSTEPYVPEGQSDALIMAVGAGDNLVVSGVCPAEARGPGCRPAGVQLRRAAEGDAGKRLGLIPAATPGLSASAFGAVFGGDGRTLYVLGRRSKGESFTVFVSRDGGATFEARDVESLAAPNDERASVRGVLETAAAAEDGTVAFVVMSRGHRSWLVVDDDGRPLAVSRPPTDNARVGAVGQRGLAFDPSSRESWESLDGGATWTPLGKLPVDPCAGAGGSSCAVPIACTAYGCLIGDALSRIGWREPEHAAVLSAPVSAEGPRRTERRVAAPFSCALDPGEWRHLGGVSAAPTAAEAALGKSAWIARRTDPRSASVSVLHAKVGANSAIEEIPLLAPKPHPEELAYYSAGQLEGVVALRYTPPSFKTPELRNVEIAWDDSMFGHVGHAVIPDAGPFQHDDFDEGKVGAKIAHPALLSIAHGGVYARLHGNLGEAQPTFFVDGRTVETIPPAVFVAQDKRRFGTDMTHLGHAHAPVWLDAGTAIRGRRGDRGWVFDGAALGFTAPEEFGLVEHASIAYVGERSALQLVTTDIAGREWKALLYPFRADGAVFDEPVRVPAQLDLPPAPRACAPADLATPRVVAPYQPGSRHPVLVTDAVEPMRVLLTADAVLHGTPDAPCVAAYDATLVSSELSSSPQSEQAVLSMTSPERAWLFRKEQAPGSPTPELTYRTMSCRVDPDAEVPPEVFRERGTLVEPR
jgi:photosystem II stability/assembly factor-like uncharacterized protein